MHLQLPCFLVDYDIIYVDEVWCSRLKVDVNISEWNINLTGV